MSLRFAVAETERESKGERRAREKHRRSDEIKMKLE